MQQIKPTGFHLIFRYKFSKYFELLMEELQFLMAAKDKFEKKSEISTFGNIRIVNTLMQGTQIDNPSFEKISTIGRILMLTLMEEIQPAVSEKYEFFVQTDQSYLFYNYLTIRIKMEGTNQLEHPAQMSDF